MDGLEKTSCDCGKGRQNRIQAACFHMQLVEAYPNGFGPILYDSEEPPAFFIFDSIGKTYYWSIATQSGSARHHSHKRTIVSFEKQTWRCRACSNNKYVPPRKEFALRQNQQLPAYFYRERRSLSTTIVYVALGRQRRSSI